MLNLKLHQKGTCADQVAEAPTPEYFESVKEVVGEVGGSGEE